MRTLDKKCGPFSSRMTWESGAASAQVIAAKKPAAPPPTTTIGRSLICPEVYPKRARRFNIGTVDVHSWLLLISLCLGEDLGSRWPAGVDVAEIRCMLW